MKNLERDLRNITEGERITVGRHKLLVGHNNSHRTNNVHRPCPHVGYRRNLLLALHIANTIKLNSVVYAQVKLSKDLATHPPNSLQRGAGI